MNSQHEEDDSDDEIDPFKSALLPSQLQEGAEAGIHQDPSPENQNHSRQELEKNNFYLSSINSNLVIRQLPSQGLSFQLWPAAITLINLLDNHLRHPSIPSSPLYDLFKSLDNGRPLRILELGSGTGLVGIAAAALLGANVTATDLPHVLPNLHFNVEANSKILQVNGGEVKVEALSWGAAEHMEAVGKEYDLILGTDVVYHDHLYAPLIETLKFFLLGNGENRVVFVMAHLKRWKKESGFFKKAKKFFDGQVIHTDPPFQGSRVGVVVYKFVGNGSFRGVNSLLS